MFPELVLVWKVSLKILDQSTCETVKVSRCTSLQHVAVLSVFITFLTSLIGCPVLCPQARVDPQRSTPVRATMVTMCTAGSLALFLDIEILSSLVSMGTLFALGLVSLAVIVRRYHRCPILEESPRTILRPSVPWGDNIVPFF